MPGSEGLLTNFTESTAEVLVSIWTQTFLTPSDHILRRVNGSEVMPVFSS